MAEIPIWPGSSSFGLVNDPTPFGFYDDDDDFRIDADKVFLVDASSIVKWNAPNIFDQVDDRFTAWRDMDNLRWTYESVQGYKPLFNDIDFDLKNKVVQHKELK